MEKCRRIASCAKTIPAIGALKPAAMAPATPQPMNISVLSTPPVVCRKKLPIVAPKWTSGPYWPTDAPPLAEMKAASVDPKPDLISSSLSLRCAAWMASAGPCHRLIPNTRRTTKMAATATSRLTIGAKDIGRSPTRSRSNNCPSRRDDSALTPRTNPLDTIAITRPKPSPVIVPIAINLSRDAVAPAFSLF